MRMHSWFIGIFLFTNSVFSQSWDWTLSTTTDSLPRKYQAMLVEIPAANFDPAIPKAGTPLYGQLKLLGENVNKSVQILWSKNDAGKVNVMWMEESLLPQKNYNYQLTISTNSSSSPQEIFKISKVDSGIDILHGNRPVYRYQDIYDPNFYGETRRPFNHVYGSDGKYITKGGDGNYPHQRGIFMGWDINGHGYWTDGGGTVQIHKSYDTSVAVMGPVFSRVAVDISWQHNKVEELVETRVVEAWWIKPGVTLLDLHFKLTEPNGKSFTLGGENAHAGMQFSAANEVYDNRDDSLLNAHHFTQDGVLRTGGTYTGTGHWLTQLFPVRGVKYLAIVMDNISNPKPVEFPTRNYGRFGVFFNATVPAGKSLPLHYRFLIANRSVQDTAGIAEAYNAFQYPPEIKFVKGLSGVYKKNTMINAAVQFRVVGKNLYLLEDFKQKNKSLNSLQLTFYNSAGKIIPNETASFINAEQKISLANMPSGLLWVQIKNDQGQWIQSLLLP